MMVQIVKAWGRGSIGRMQEVQPNMVPTLVRRGIAVVPKAATPTAPPAVAAQPPRKPIERKVTKSK